MTGADRATSDETTPSFEGAWGYQNWRAFLENEPEKEAIEVALYSDQRFTGELTHELGPYKLLNPVPSELIRDPALLALVLRTSWHLKLHNDEILDLFRKGQTDITRYHGGDVYDEIGALLSLNLGCKLHAGGVIRDFYRHDDTRGRPRVEEPHRAPRLPPRYGHPTIPRLDERIALRPGLIPTYPKLPWSTASRILRAARSYQNAMWIADSDPQLAWLMLVAAVETASGEWARLAGQPSESSSKLLARLHPVFAEGLEKAAGEQAPAVFRIVGQELAQVLRAQRRFLDFLLSFKPEPPTPRPVASRIDWTDVSLERIFKVVYGYRSKALHESQPFPAPMCQAPFPGMADERGRIVSYSERPGGAEFSHGGFWTEAELPINLYAFEHVTRHSLLNFWRWAAAEHTVGVESM